MRVTQQMMSSSLLTNLNQLRQRTAVLSDQVSSGNRITRVSEDPTAGADVMRIQSRGQSLKQWKTNLNDTKSWVYATEAKLGDITNLLNEAKELALTASNGTASDETRKALAPGAEQLLTNLMAALNEKEPNGFLFGGFQTETQIDTATGARLDAFSLNDVTGQVTYNGDAGVMQRDVGPRLTLDANMPGSRVVDDSDPDNMVALLWELKTALKTPVIKDGNGDGSIDTDTNADGIADQDLNNDLYIDVDANADSVIDAPTATSKLMPKSEAAIVNRIKVLVAKLDSQRQNVIALRSEMGARQIRIEAMETSLQNTEVKLESSLEQAQGVDPAKAILDLTNAQTTYQAALQVGARILPQTLADFLR
ncbi:MAG: flagellar hook-associated protein 3 [Symbiobacteriaceae bacterium]|jgi:flagellar hook-associated protein 3 FlgL|nr:flagellar hook-associated protein 3 [Symbiobacteriaceae bacterium]